MRYNKILTLAMSLVLLDTASAIGATPASMSEADLAGALQKLTAQAEQMQQQINSLQAELRITKQSTQRTAPVVTTPAATTNSVVKTAVVTTPTTPAIKARNNAPVAGTGVVATQTAVRRMNARSRNATTLTPDTPVDRATTAANYKKQMAAPLPALLTADEEAHQEQEDAINFLIGSTVLSSPVLNIHSAYDASDLIVNQSTMNEDLRFLIQRRELEKILGTKAELPSATRPRVFLSGKIESQAFYFDPFGGPASTGIDLTGLELDVLAEASPWAFGFMSINFEQGSLRNPSTLGSGNPVNNSRLFLKRGFLTIGNLDKTPVYFSMGQLYVPFGDYSTYMLSNPVTISEGRTNTRAAVLGFYRNGVYLSTYLLNGAVNTPEGFNAFHVYEWGLNGGYKYASDSGLFKYNLGAGFINNIAEAQGYQLNGLGSGFFQGFAAHPDTEIIDHPVGGIDAYASIVFGPLSLISEYITASRDFAQEDLSFNDEGAKPHALHLEADYTFKLFDQAFALFLAYDQTWQSLALNLPRASYIAGLSTSIWKNTIEAIEYRHDENYSDDTTAGGICQPGGTGDPIFCPVPIFGSSQNQLLLQIGVYF